MSDMQTGHEILEGLGLLFIISRVGIRDVIWGEGVICPPDFLKCQCFDEIGVLDSRKIRKYVHIIKFAPLEKPEMTSLVGIRIICPPSSTHSLDLLEQFAEDGQVMSCSVVNPKCFTYLYIKYAIK